MAELNQDLLEVMMDLDEAGDIFEECDFIVDEGANMDMTDAMRAHYGEIKNNIKSAKKKIKQKEFSGAKSDLNKAKSELKQLEGKIKKAESTVGSALLGYLAGGLLNSLELLCPTVLGLIGSHVMGAGTIKAAVSGLNMVGAAAAGATEEELNQMANGMVKGLAKTGVATVLTFINKIYMFVKEIIILVKTIKQFIKDIKDKDVSTPDALNLYRNKLLTYCSDLEKKISKTEQLVEKRSQMK